MFPLATLLLYLSLVLLAVLVCYALCSIILPVLFYFAEPKVEARDVSDRGEIDILIPSHNEAETVLHAIKSISDQDYLGTVRIHVIFKDVNDNSIELIEKEFGPCKDSFHECYLRNNRILKIHLCGASAKREKLNHTLPLISGDYIGFLDADHRAKSNWVSNSLTKILVNNLDGVQAKRYPLSLKKIIQLWDSAQNHIGNEILNGVLSCFKTSLFFTGTTCIFKADTLNGRFFSDCITEDTYLSYQLILDGKQIGYDSVSGSYEENAGNIKSYLARRRRWSNGHTQAFFTFLPQLLKSKLSAANKGKLIIHGLFYLLPAVICTLLNLYSLYAFLQLTLEVQAVVIFISLLISAALAYCLTRRYRNLLLDTLVTVLWIFPQVVLATPYFLKLMGKELYYYILVFPYSVELLSLHIGLIIIPLLSLLLGSLLIRQLNLVDRLKLIATYPFIVFFDIFACLLGTSDLLFKKNVWLQIQRSGFDDVISTRKPLSYFLLITKAVGFSCVLGFILIIANDLLAARNCGEISKLSYPPILFNFENELLWKVQYNKENIEDKRLRVNFTNDFSSSRIDNLSEYSLWRDGKLIKEFSLVSGHSVIETATDLPFGWKEQSAQYSLKRGDREVCSRAVSFSTRLVELRGRDIYVNGEIFLIKGIIPSFSNFYTKLSLLDGLKQIKDVGANAIRLYHAISREIDPILKDTHLLVVDQPNDSTWNNIDISKANDRRKLLHKFIDLDSRTRANPFLLFHFLGNELELSKREGAKEGIHKLIQQIKAQTPYDPFGYSTYMTNTNYQVDILGVNMLDSGSVYWNRAVDILTRYEKPILASEFGGFVAFSEHTPESYRVHRFLKQWKILNDKGFVGAMFFQSHDNWAQSVPSGYNDPFLSEQPDDLRGIWDRDNLPKLELRFVEEMFSDLEVKVMDQLVTSSQSEISLHLLNKRRYQLSNIILYSKSNLALTSAFDLLPNEMREVKISLKDISTQDIAVTASFSTHSGLRSQAKLHIKIPLLTNSPTVLNNDFIAVQKSSEQITGQLLSSDTVEFVMPKDWPSALVSGNEVHGGGKRHAVYLRPVMQTVSDCEVNFNDTGWKSCYQSFVGKGTVEVRFRLPKGKISSGYLLLEGLGTEEIFISSAVKPATAGREVHKYRENIIPINSLPVVDESEQIYLSYERTSQTYTSKNKSPFGKEIRINFTMPMVFSPIEVAIHKGN